MVEGIKLYNLGEGVTEGVQHGGQHQFVLLRCPHDIDEEVKVGPVDDDSSLAHHNLI